MKAISTQDGGQDSIADRLSERGVRLTKARSRVLEALSSSEGPLSASQLWSGLDQQIPLSSIYRSLAVLTGAGILSAHHGPGDTTRYEPAEWLGGHHHHLVCTTCGAVEDVELSPRHEMAVERAVEAAARIGHFSAHSHALEIAGQCRRCR